MRLLNPNRTRKYWKSNNKNEGYIFNVRILKGFKQKGMKQKGYVSWY